MNKDIKCGECRQVIAGVADANYQGLDPANSLCHDCAVK